MIGGNDRRWAVLYDADCGFCTWLVSVLLRWDCEGRLHPIALQRSEVDDLLREVAPAERIASWHLISTNGERRSGGAAVPPILPAAVCERFPKLTDRGYRWVAEHRLQLSRWLPSSAKRRARRRVHERELVRLAETGVGAAAPE